MTIRNFQFSFYSDYYYNDADGFVYSTKSGYARPLTWAAWGNKQPRVTLTNTQGVKKTYTREQILTLLVPLEQNLTTKNKSAQMEQTQATKVEFLSRSKSHPFVVTDFGTNSASAWFSDEKSAKKHAEDMALIRSGTKFYVMKVVGAVTANGVTWE